MASLDESLSGHCRMRFTELDPATGDVVLERLEPRYEGQRGDVRTNVPWSVCWHSPDGYEWGYGGSGPADLALNILNLFVPPGSDGEEPVKCYRGHASATAVRLHQEFKRDFICGMDEQGGVIPGVMIRIWITEHRSDTH